MTLNGNGGLDASGADGATIAYTNPGALVVANTSTSAASITLTLTGTNTGDNVLTPTLADAVDGGAGFGVPTKLSKTGHGTWILPSANTFTGDVSVTGGVLKVRNDSALGASGNTVSVIDATNNANPSSVVFDNPNGLTVANNFKTSGGGGGGQDPDGPGILHAVAGATTLSGILTNTSGGGFSTYTADAGATLNITGTITNDTARTLYLGGAGTGNISGMIQNGTGTQGIEKRGVGTWNITGVNNAYTGGTTVAAGVLDVSGSVATSSGVTVNGGAFHASAAQTVKALNVTGGVAAVTTATKAALTVGDGTGATNPITITGGSVDLQGNGLIVRYAPGNDPAVLQSVRGQIVAAYNAGGAAWQGSGIGSSTAAANSSGAVGYALATEVLPFADGSTDTFMGSPVDTGSVVARYTLGGDATLDGSVDFNDLVKLAQNYNTTVSATTDSWWNKGDFTYDGIVDFNDLVKLAQNYNTAIPTDPIAGASAVFQADLARAFASVPEPGTLSILGLGAVALMGRRRRRKI
jgi:autotransporter-associated beta strand protein